MVCSRLRNTSNSFSRTCCCSILKMRAGRSNQVRWRAFPPAFPWLLWSTSLLADWAARALRSGVKAILPRDSGMDEILSAIQAAHAGLVLLDAEVTQTLAARIPTPAVHPAPALDDLTPREVEVLRMLAEGLGNREMAGRLGISDHTVKFHISSILDKLGASTRTEAVTMGIRVGIILL